MAVLPGKTLERYELLNRIAVGGMAEVYRAVAYGAHGFEKTLAIKRILPELARDPEFEARFIAEAKLAVQLTHANVVQVFDFGRFAGGLFIAMEYIDGLDLAALLKHNRESGERIPIPAAFQIAIEITRGLDFAHQAGVVHRDVSPSNILLSKAGEVKIADFGIAQAAASERRARPSGRRRIMGKWRYMSPEQTQGGDDLSTRSDLFSAAAVLFELFTGDKLFPGEDAEAIISNIHDMEIPKASERRPGLPPRLDQVLARCLQREPADRPGKPGEVVRALTEISYESSIVATALDVAECVRGALAEIEEEVDGETPASPDRRAGIDDLIKKQLGGALGGPPPAKTGMARKTAVDTGEPTELSEELPADDGRKTHTATVVKKGVGADGLTLWELDESDEDDSKEDTVAAVPSAIRTGKTTGANRAIADASLAGESSASESSGGRGLWLALIAIILVGGGAGVWAMSRGGDEPAEAARPSASPADAAPLIAPPEARVATLILDSVPAGARVWVDGEELPERTPTTAEVDPAAPHRIEIEAEYHARWSLEDVQVEAGKTFPIKPTLVPLRAGLKVETDPPGATAVLDGNELGVTPLERDDLDPGNGRKLVLRKRGYEPARVTVDLVAGETSTVVEELEVQVVFGTIRIAVPGWAEVYFRGKKIATVPRQAVKLPVGKHRLRLVNPPSKKETMLDVEVVSGETRVFRVTSW